MVDSGKLVKMEKDFSGEVDAALIRAEELALVNLLKLICLSS
jgi:hypothetical protein